MATDYQTSDGKVFKNQDYSTNRARWDAEDHQAELDKAAGGGGSNSRDVPLSWAKANDVRNEMASEKNAIANEIVSYYNRGDWDSVIRLYEKNTGLQSVAGAFYCVICAYAKKGHYERVLDLCFDYHWNARQGNGVTQNLPEAAEWYSKAAAQGHAGSQYNLACYYWNDEYVKQDKKQALEWFEKAAAQGHAEAKSLLKDYRTKKVEFAIAVVSDIVAFMTGN